LRASALAAATALSSVPHCVKWSLPRSCLAKSFGAFADQVGVAHARIEGIEPGEAAFLGAAADDQ
jgi:hypothetical protein